MKAYKKFLQRLEAIGWNMELIEVPVVKNIGLNEDGTPKTKSYSRLLYKGSFGAIKANFYSDRGLVTFSAPRFHMDIEFGNIKKIILKENSKEVIIKFNEAQIGLYYGE